MMTFLNSLNAENLLKSATNDQMHYQWYIQHLRLGHSSSRPPLIR